MKARRLFFALVCALMIPAFALWPSHGMAEEKTVLVLNLDKSEEGALSSILYRDVVERISTHLQKAGFKTLQPTSSSASSLSEDAANGDRELLDRLRAENQQAGDKPKIEYVALVQILADMVLMETGTRIKVEIRGRMLDIAEDRPIAIFDLPLPGDIIAPSDCTRKCIIGLLQENTRLIADSLGQVLGQRLKLNN